MTDATGAALAQGLPSMMFIGIDLAWAEGSATKPPNETGLVILQQSGQIAAAGWTIGIDETLAWLDSHARGHVLLFVDAPLVVNNETKQRTCERQVGERYGRWSVSANSTNRRSRRLAGVRLRERLELSGWTYSDGRAGPPHAGRVLCECYPYTTIVGTPELGYDTQRPRYKRRPKAMPAAEFRQMRAKECDELIHRVGKLAAADPPVDLRSHPNTRALLEERSPLTDTAYKHREDLLDAVLCAWTASLWSRWGSQRCQVLGLGDEDCDGRIATIMAPARPDQRARS